MAIESVFNLPVKVIPGASSSNIAGWLGDTLRVRVTAAPERGKANAAVESIVAEALGLPKSAVRIVSGKTSARKILAIEGLSKSDVMRLLAAE